MAEQYIGARYVPKFHKNSVDPSSIEWDANVPYEAITVVSYQGDSYTSKIPVPASVGNPSANPTYWARTGQFNAAIAGLQQNLLALQNNVNEIIAADFLNGKKIVAYGDSTVNNGGGSSSYLNYVCNAVNATLTNRAIPGTNISRSTNNGISLINASTDLPSFDVCFLGYGVSEFNTAQSESAIRTDIKNLINAVRAKSSTITILFALPYFIVDNTMTRYGGTRNDRGFTIEDFNNIIISELYGLKVPYYNFATRSTCGPYTYTQKLLNDNSGITFLHPNEEFKKELASIVLNGAECVNEKMLRNILNDFDFTQARHAVSWDEMVAAGGLTSGCILKVTAGNVSQSSVKNLFTGIYLVKGKTDHAFTLDFGTSQFDVASGDFCLNIPFSTQSGYIKITALTDDVIITNFGVYYYDDYQTSGFRFNGVATGNLIAASGVTNLITPKLDVESGVLHSFGLQITDYTQLSYEDPIYSFDGGADFGTLSSFIIGYDGNGKPCILMANGSRLLVAIQPTTNGIYYFPPYNVTPIKQNY